MPDGVETTTPTLEQCALGRLARTLPASDSAEADTREPELAWLATHARYADTPPSEAPLARLAARFGLSVAETYAAALCRAVESDPMAGRALYGRGERLIPRAGGAVTPRALGGVL